MLVARLYTLEEGQMLTIIILTRARRSRHRGVVALRDRVAGRGGCRNGSLGGRLHRLISTARCSLGLSGVALFLAGGAYLIYKWTRTSKSGSDPEPK